jgi:hypothetical protein
MVILLMSGSTAPISGLLSDESFEDYWAVGPSLS